MTKTSSRTIKATTHEQIPTRSYSSNPFTLAFYAFGRLFDRNTGWAIAFLVIGFFAAGSQLTNSAMEKQHTGNELGNVASHVSSLSHEQMVGLIVAGAIVIGIVATIAIAIFALQTFIGGVFVYVSLHSEKDKKVSIGEALSATRKRFRRLFLAQGLAAIKIFLWTLLLIVPGIIAALRYFLLPYIIMDEPEGNKGVIAAHTN